MICFPIAGTKIQVEFSFIAVCALLSAMGNTEIFICGFIAAALHELSHLTVMTFFHMKTESIIFHGCGIRICPKQVLCSYEQELIMLLAGPFANIAAWALMTIISCSTSAAQAQLMIGLINLLPCRKLDGGGALCCAFSMTRLGFFTAERILRSIFIFTPIFMIFIGFLCNITNFTYYMLLVYLLLSEIFL